MEHQIKINGQNMDRWGMFFRDGIYQELIKAPKRKVSPLAMSLADQDGEETDRFYNKYESRNLSLPACISAGSESELLIKYNLFVSEVVLTGKDIVLDSVFLKRRFILRYIDISSTNWGDTDLIFDLEVMDDYPSELKPIV